MLFCKYKRRLSLKKTEYTLSKKTALSRRHFFSAVLALFSFSTSAAASEYMLINANHYRQTVASARSKISAYLTAMAPMRHNSLNAQVETIVNSLLDSPYMSTGAMGEGDWVPTSPTYKPGAVHIDQDPVYRLDGLDCQTFVQMVMGLLYSNNLNEFDTNMIKIAYGAVDLTEKSQIHYYNRNHFVDADFNRVNQYRGFLQDVTSTGVLSEYAKKTNATVSLYDWLAKQRENPQSYVRVLNDSDGIFMMKNFMLDYQDLDIDKVKERVVSISYLPKATLAIKQSDNSYQPNQGLLDLIPTPAIAEIVCDAKSWTIGGRNIKDVIGTEMSVSHFGVLYRKTFAKNAVIYRRISCSYNKSNKPCQVTPVVCDQEQCKELMFAHATDGYPASHYWYQLADGNYTCTAKKPAKGAKYTMCNRVEALPFFSYITNNQDGAYWYMNTPSILGVHIEKLLPRP